MENTIKFVSSAGGLGYLPRMPGTWGSLGGVALYLLLCHVGWGTGWRLVGLTLAASVVSVVIGNYAVVAYGRRDPPCFVLDEVCGMLCACWWLDVYPAGSAIIAAFILFRAFDIIKPSPIRRLEHYPGGWGIMLDDLAAGLAANLLVHTYYVWWSPIP